MKKRQIWRKVTACILAALMLTLTLTACGEASSLVTEENEETGGLEEPADDSTAGTTAAAADSADASEQDAAAPAEADSASTEAAATEEEGQNPVMNFIGPYAWSRASAMVEAAGSNGARISIDWASSAAEGSRWVMTGELDTETLTVKYTDCVKTDYVFGEDGEIESETVQYENGTGTITFHDDGPLTFTCLFDHVIQSASK